MLFPSRNADGAETLEFCLSNFWKLTKAAGSLVSPSRGFSRGMTFAILVHPRGAHTAEFDPPCMSVFIEAVKQPWYPPDWVFPNVRFELTVVNHVDPASSVSCWACWTFSAAATSRGWQRMISHSKITRAAGFLSEMGSVLLRARVEVPFEGPWASPNPSTSEESLVELIRSQSQAIQNATCSCDNGSCALHPITTGDVLDPLQSLDMMLPALHPALSSYYLQCFIQILYSIPAIRNVILACTDTLRLPGEDSPSSVIESLQRTFGLMKLWPLVMACDTLSSHCERTLKETAGSQVPPVPHDFRLSGPVQSLVRAVMIAQNAGHGTDPRLPRPDTREVLSALDLDLVSTSDDDGAEGLSRLHSVLLGTVRNECVVGFLTRTLQLAAQQVPQQERAQAAPAFEFTNMCVDNLAGHHSGVLEIDSTLRELLSVETAEALPYSTSWAYGRHVASLPKAFEMSHAAGLGAREQTEHPQVLFVYLKHMKLLRKGDLFDVPLTMELPTATDTTYHLLGLVFRSGSSGTPASSGACRMVLRLQNRWYRVEAGATQLLTCHVDFAEFKCHRDFFCAAACYVSSAVLEMGRQSSESTLPVLNPHLYHRLLDGMGVTELCLERQLWAVEYFFRRTCPDLVKNASFPFECQEIDFAFRQMQDDVVELVSANETSDPFGGGIASEAILESSETVQVVRAALANLSAETTAGSSNGHILLATSLVSAVLRCAVVPESKPHLMSLWSVLRSWMLGRPFRDVESCSQRDMRHRLRLLVDKLEVCEFSLRLGADEVSTPADLSRRATEECLAYLWVLFRHDFRSMPADAAREMASSLCLACAASIRKTNQSLVDSPNHDIPASPHRDLILAENRVVSALVVGHRPSKRQSDSVVEQRPAGVKRLRPESYSSPPIPYDVPNAYDVCLSLRPATKGQLVPYRATMEREMLDLLAPFTAFHVTPEDAFRIDPDNSLCPESHTASSSSDALDVPGEGSCRVSVVLEQDLYGLDGLESGEPQGTVRLPPGRLVTVRCGCQASVLYRILRNVLRSVEENAPCHLPEFTWEAQRLTDRFMLYVKSNEGRWSYVSPSTSLDDSSLIMLLLPFLVDPPGSKVGEGIIRLAAEESRYRNSDEVRRTDLRPLQAYWSSFGPFPLQSDAQTPMLIFKWFHKRSLTLVKVSHRVVDSRRKLFEYVNAVVLPIARASSLLSPEHHDDVDSVKVLEEQASGGLARVRRLNAAIKRLTKTTGDILIIENVDIAKELFVTSETKRREGLLPDLSLLTNVLKFLGSLPSADISEQAAGTFTPDILAPIISHETWRSNNPIVLSASMLTSLQNRVYGDTKKARKPKPKKTKAKKAPARKKVAREYSAPVVTDPEAARTEPALEPLPEVAKVEDSNAENVDLEATSDKAEDSTTTREEPVEALLPEVTHLVDEFYASPEPRLSVAHNLAETMFQMALREPLDFTTQVEVVGCVGQRVPALPGRLWVFTRQMEGLLTNAPPRFGHAVLEWWESSLVSWCGEGCQVGEYSDDAGDWPEERLRQMLDPRVEALVYCVLVSFLCSSMPLGSRRHLQQFFFRLLVQDGDQLASMALHAAAGLLLLRLAPLRLAEWTDTVAGRRAFEGLHKRVLQTIRQHALWTASVPVGVPGRDACVALSESLLCWCLESKPEQLLTDLNSLGGGGPSVAGALMSHTAHHVNSLEELRAVVGRRGPCSATPADSRKLRMEVVKNLTASLGFDSLLTSRRPGRLQVLKQAPSVISDSDSWCVCFKPSFWHCSGPSHTSFSLQQSREAESKEQQVYRLSQKVPWSDLLDSGRTESFHLWLMKTLPQLETMLQWKSLECGLVHRIDLETSGALLCAKTGLARDELWYQFRKRQVGKEYLLLCHGRLQSLNGRVRTQLSTTDIDSRSRANRSHYTRVVTNGGEEAITEYTVLKVLKRKPWTEILTNLMSQPPSIGELEPVTSTLTKRQLRERLAKLRPSNEVVIDGNDDDIHEGVWLETSSLGEATEDEYFSLCRSSIVTGRTHQIRVHFEHLGHPLVSDTKYLTAEKCAEDRLWCPRMFLHSTSLTFNDPDVPGTPSITVKCPVPSELEQAVRSGLDLVESFETTEAEVLHDTWVDEAFDSDFDEPLWDSLSEEDHALKVPDQEPSNELPERHPTENDPPTKRRNLHQEPIGLSIGIFLRHRFLSTILPLAYFSLKSGQEAQFPADQNWLSFHEKEGKLRVEASNSLTRPEGWGMDIQTECLTMSANGPDLLEAHPFTQWIQPLLPIKEDGFLDWSPPALDVQGNSRIILAYVVEWAVWAEHLVTLASHMASVERIAWSQEELAAIEKHDDLADVYHQMDQQFLVGLPPEIIVTPSEDYQ